MSSFVTSDHNIMSIVHEMHALGFIDDEDFGTVCNALRIMNEEMTGSRYEYRIEHIPVNIEARREYTAEESYVSCLSWIYQVTTGQPMSGDQVTMLAAVKMLCDKIANFQIESGAWRTRIARPGGEPIFEKLTDEYGTWMNVREIGSWDLAE